MVKVKRRKKVSKMTRKMKTKLMEYDYEIDAISGEIIGFDIAPLKK